MIKHNLIQGSDEWLKFRKSKIGASDAGYILRLSPWKTANRLWLEKLDLIEKEPSNFAMKRGTELEEQARHKYIAMTGINVFPIVCEHSDYDWMIASMDGLSFDERHAVEIKCPGRKDHALALDGKVPEKYYPQLQHQLAVLNLDNIDYFSFDGEHGVIIKIERNEEYINNLIEKEKEFYRCMQELEAPALTDDDYEIRTDREWLDTALQYRLVKMEMKELEAREKSLKETLYGMSNHANSIGGGIRLQKIVKRGCIEYSRIPHLEGVNLDEYRKPRSEYWKMSEI
jgi:putative phage-type endonuclease